MTISLQVAHFGKSVHTAISGAGMIVLFLSLYYFTVDGCYWLYWNAVDPAALVMREANFYASTCLYFLCGFIWLHNGP